MASPGAPAAPTIFGLRDAHRLVIQWEEPASDGGAALTGYEVRHRTSAQPGATPPVPAGQWQTTTGVALTARAEYEISNLLQFQSYDIQVAAVNGDGTSDFSASLVTSTLEADDMTILNRQLTKVQSGPETTAGTLVPATRIVPFVEASYNPMITRKRLKEITGIASDDTTIVTRRYSELELTQELDLEYLIGVLRCGLADVNPVGSGANPRVWTFTPARNAYSALDTESWEITETDGSTLNYRRSFGNARPTSITIEGSGEETAQLSVTWMGRAAQALNSPANVDEIPNRTILPVGLFELYIDDSWANLGNTQVGSIRDFSVDIDPGLDQAFNPQGRDDLDPAGWYRSPVEATFSFTFDHDGSATGELGHWEDGDQRFVRLQAETGTGNTLRRLRIDACIQYLETPDVLAAEEDQHTLALTGELLADGTAANNRLRIVVANGLSAW